MRRSRTAFPALSATSPRPAPGSSVQRLRIASSAYQFAQNSAPQSVSNYDVLNAGASALLSAIASASPSTPSQAVIWQAEANSSGEGVCFQGTAGPGNQEGPHLVPGEPLILNNIDPTTILVVNRDTIAHTVRVLLTPTIPIVNPLSFNGGAALDGFGLLGLTVGPTDLLRIRRCSIQIDAGSPACRFSDNASLLVFAPSALTVKSRVPGAEMLLRGLVGSTFAQSEPNGYGVRYVSEAVMDIIGTDIAPGGTPVSPQFYFNAGCAAIANNSLASVIMIQIDYYPGANQ